MSMCSPKPLSVDKFALNSLIGIVALPETFPLLRALLNLLKESLGRSKPATNLMQAQ